MNANLLFFTNLEAAEQFKINNLKYLRTLSNFLQDIENIEYTEIWLNKNAPSCVVGFDQHDEIIVETPILHKAILPNLQI